MTDIEALRERYATQVKKCDNCRDGLGYLVPCGVCGYVEGNTPGDPSVLALCDEVENLRAQVAAAPEVLREWPTVEILPRLAGEWVWVWRGDSAVSRFYEHDGRVLFADAIGQARSSGDLEPGEFFVRVP